MLEDREQVLQPERRAHAIDPDHALDPVPGALEQRHRHRPRLLLLRRDDRVLEVDRDHVGAGRERLGEPVGPGPGHEQEVAPRLDFLVVHALSRCARPPCH